MMANSELSVLSAWCRAHDLRWLQTQDVDGITEVRLQAEGRSATRQRTTLIRRDGEFCLVDASGNALASSSALQSVLDAIEGGVAGLADGPNAARRICLV